MTSASYQIAVLDPITGAVRREFDGAAFFDLQYSRNLNDPGSLVLTVPATAANIAAFSLDAFIEVRRTSPVNGKLEVEETYLVRLMQRFRQDNDERFAIGAQSLNHLLMRRLIDPADDPASIDGYSTKTGAADTVMYNYANEQAAAAASLSRRTPGLTVNLVPGVANPVSKTCRFDNLFVVLKDLGVKGRQDFHIDRISGAAMALNIGTLGVDRRQSSNYPFAPWVGLDPRRGNLSNPNLIVDRQAEGTLVYCQGQGQGAARQLLTMSGAGITDSPFNRIEFTQDARTTAPTDATGLLTAAVGALFAKQAQFTFNYTLSTDEGGNTYRLDWDIGDYVTAFWDTFRSDLRITGAQLNVTDRGETIAVSLEPIINV